MKIKKDTVVTMHYKLSDEAGAVVDESAETDPLVFLYGHGNLVEGLEDAMLGRSIRDSFKVVVPAAKGYGELDSELVYELSLANFDDPSVVKPGLQFVGQSADGHESVVRVVDVNAGTGKVKVDANHPMAGKDLFFDISIVDVRAASAEELSHGHVHGPGGHHHH